MHKRALLSVLSFVMTVLSSNAQGFNEFSISANPTLLIPIDLDTMGYTLGGGGALNATYALPSMSWLDIRGGIGYAAMGTGAETGVSFISAGAGPGLHFPLSPEFAYQAYLSGGYYVGLYRNLTGSGPYFGGGMGITFRPSKLFSVGLSASYEDFFSLSSLRPVYQGVGIQLGIGLHLGGGKTDFIQYKDIRLDPVFPVFSKYYDANSFGRLIVKNTSNAILKNVRVSFFVKQYMDAPRFCTEIPELKGNGETTVDLYALFNNGIMEVTEATSAQATIIVEYTSQGESAKFEQSASLRIYDRNALTWDDDRKAAAFVTSKDPVVLEFAKKAAGIVRDSANTQIDVKLRSAMAIFETLKLSGIRYVTDPKTPYLEFSKNSNTIDFLQFPAQTLQYKAGDCDDLSILMCALLESIGIETAFITAPGHIFMAFALDINENEAKKFFPSSREYLVKNGRVWMPVEMTLVGQGFVKAVESAWDEWQKSQTAGETGFYPLAEAWKLYEPIGIKGVKAVLPPDTKTLQTAYEKSLNLFIDLGMKPQLEAIQAKLKQSPNDATLINKLGVIYARYDQLKLAEEQFKTCLKQGELVPALINLGNIYFIKRDYKNALAYYKRAKAKNPRNVFALLAIGMAEYELGNYSAAQDAITVLSEVSPDMAKKHKYLTAPPKDATRNSFSETGDNMEWSEESIEE